MERNRFFFVGIAKLLKQQVTSKLQFFSINKIDTKALNTSKILLLVVCRAIYLSIHRFVFLSTSLFFFMSLMSIVFFQSSLIHSILFLLLLLLFLFLLLALTSFPSLLFSFSFFHHFHFHFSFLLKYFSILNTFVLSFQLMLISIFILFPFI